MVRPHSTRWKYNDCWVVMMSEYHAGILDGMALTTEERRYQCFAMYSSVACDWLHDVYSAGGFIRDAVLENDGDKLWSAQPRKPSCEPSMFVHGHPFPSERIEWFKSQREATLWKHRLGVSISQRLSWQQWSMESFWSSPSPRQWMSLQCGVLSQHHHKSQQTPTTKKKIKLTNSTMALRERPLVRI